MYTYIYIYIRRLGRDRGGDPKPEIVSFRLCSRAGGRVEARLRAGARRCFKKDKDNTNKQIYIGIGAFYKVRGVG